MTTSTIRMCRTALLLLVVLAAGLPASAAGAGTPPPRFHGRGVAARDVPGYAREVFAYVLKNGRAPKGYVGGRVWQNREHRLPKGGEYREYDVHPKVRGVNRGAERIIVDKTAAKGWFTADHYRTFIPIGAQ